MEMCLNSDRASFLRAWLKNPLKIASVTPSSCALAMLITSEVGPATGRVLELGVGTGVFTKALIVRGVLESDLTLIGQNIDFLEILKDRYPQARALSIDASRMARYRDPEERSFGATVSGLPLLSMPTRSVMAILASSFRMMGERGKFYQFTYGPRCPVPRAILDRLGLKAVKIGRTNRNIPPAAVYRISRRHLSLAGTISR